HRLKASLKTGRAHSSAYTPGLRCLNLATIFLKAGIPQTIRRVRWWNPIELFSPGAPMKANSAARLFVLAAMTAGLTSLAPHVAWTKERKPSEPNRVPLGLKLLTDHQRLLVFQDRLRGLCEVATAERVAAGQWRANCTDSNAFIIKVYRDGFMTVTRSSSAAPRP